jgi:hypothetical protein
MEDKNRENKVKEIKEIQRKKERNEKRKEGEIMEAIQKNIVHETGLPSSRHADIMTSTNRFCTPARISFYSPKSVVKFPSVKKQGAEFFEKLHKKCL